MFSKKGTKFLIIVFNQSYFKVDSSKPIQLRRKIRVIKREPIRLALIKYLFQTGTNSASGDSGTSRKYFTYLT